MPYTRSRFSWGLRKMLLLPISTSSEDAQASATAISCRLKKTAPPLCTQNISATAAHGTLLLLLLRNASLNNSFESIAAAKQCILRQTNAAQLEAEEDGLSAATSDRVVSLGFAEGWGAPFNPVFECIAHSAASMHMLCLCRTLHPQRLYEDEADGLSAASVVFLLALGLLREGRPFAPFSSAFFSVLEASPFVEAAGLASALVSGSGCAKHM